MNTKSPLSDSLEEAFSHLERGGFLQAMRTRAFSSFQKIGLPEPKDEAFRYVRIRSLLEKSVAVPAKVKVDLEDVQKHIALECKGAALVLVNGVYEPSLSTLEALPKNVQVMSLEEGMKKFGVLMQGQLAKEQAQQKDPFALLSNAFCSSGIFLYLPPLAVVEALEILHLIVPEEGKNVVIAPHIELVQAKDSHSKIYCKTACLGKTGSYLSLPYFSSTLEEGATSVVYESKEEHSAEGWQFACVKGRVKKNGVFRHLQVSQGCKADRTHIDVSLLGEGANTELDGLSFQKENTKSHIYVTVRHESPMTTSRQLYKSALYDASKFSFEGKIYVAKDAQKTDAFQLNNNLLLGDGAEADSKPNLEIYADDVKASHGATCGKLSREQKFYLLSRGLSDNQATGILVEAYCQEVLERIPFLSCKKALQKQIRT